MKQLILHIMFIILLFSNLILNANSSIPSGVSNAKVPSELRFRNLSIEDGLSHPVVQGITQDSYGFMWFGTKDGLNKYDGNKFEVFRNDPEDPHSLSDNEIRYLYTQKSGLIWIATALGGLNSFDPSTGKFTIYKNDPADPKTISSNSVEYIYEDSAGFLWIGTLNNGLNRFDPASKSFVRYLHDPKNSDSIGPGEIWSIMEDKKGSLWVGTAAEAMSGLHKLDRNSGKFTHYYHDQNNPLSLAKNRTVRSLHEDKYGTFWIGTHGGSLQIFDRKEKKFSQLDTNKRITSSLEDSFGNLWFSSNSGILKYDFTTKEFSRYIHNKNTPYSLSHDVAIRMFEDNSGQIWVGTYGGGISVFDPAPNKFKHYKNEPGNLNSLADNNIQSIYLENDDILWAGSWKGCLTRINLKTGKHTNYLHDPENPECISGGERLQAIYVDKEGYVWSGHFDGEGLDKLDPKTGKFTHYTHDPKNSNSISSDAISSIIEDKSGFIWIGTSGGGLNRFDKNKEIFTHYRNKKDDPNTISDDRTLCVYEDSKGFLWVGTWSGGVNRYNPHTGVFKSYKHNPDDINSIAGNKVFFVYEDKSQKLWFGTTGGLCKFDDTKEIFTCYNQSDGLPANLVGGIGEDSKDNLWLSTNKGISKFNPKNKTFMNYDAYDGLQDNTFNPGAYSQSKRGEIFFGGIKGINSFFPNEIKPKALTPRRALTALSDEEKAWIKAHPEIQLSINIKHKPLGFIDKNGSLKGLTVDYVRLLEQKLGLKIDLVGSDWPTALDRALKYEVDGVTNAAEREERKQYLNFTDVYFRYPIAAIAHKEKPIISSLNELCGKKVAVIKKESLNKHIQDHFPCIKRVEFNNSNEQLNALITGKVEVVMGSYLALTLETKKMRLLENKLIYYKYMPPSGFARIGIRKDRPILHSLLNKAIDSITEEEHDQIATKWFGHSLPPIPRDTTLNLTRKERIWLKNHPVFRVSSEPDYIPFDFRIEGVPKGYSIDFMNLIAKKAGFEIEWVKDSWKNILKKAKKKEIDLVHSIFKGPKDRDVYLNFSKPYKEAAGEAIVTRIGAPDLKTLNDLKNVKVGMLEGGAYTNTLKTKLPEVEIITYPRVRDILDAVAVGKVDATVMALPAALYHIRTSFVNNLRVSGDLGEAEKRNNYHIAVRKDWPIMISILNKAINSVTIDEKIALDKKWHLYSEKAYLQLTTSEQAWLVTNPEITLGFNPDMAPLVIVGEQGELSGILVDIYKKLESLIGLKINIKIDEWSSTIQKAKEGKIDGLLAATPGLTKSLGFMASKALLPSTPVIFAREDAPFNINTLQDIKGKKITVLKGVHLTNKVWAPYKESAKIIETTSVLEMLRMVYEGKADAAIGLNYHNYTIRDKALFELKPVLFLQQYEDIAAASIRSDWPQLVSIINKALDVIGKPKLQAINQKWTGLKEQKSTLDLEPQIISAEIVFKQTATIIKWIAAFFTLIVLFLFAYWLLKGRPSQFSIRLSILLTAVVFSALIVVNAVLVLILLKGEQRQEEIEKRKYQSIQLALELKQSSDNLTRFARTYTVTGDPKYEEYFQAIIRIRDGKQPHPKEFSQIYWDQVAAGIAQLNEGGETYSIEQRMIDLGMSNLEIEKLQEAKLKSDTLINIENIAMDTIKGLNKDNKGNFTAKDEPVLKMARELLHSEEYYTAKARIMKPINDFYILIERRIDNELKTERAKNKAVLLAMAGTVGLTIAFLLFTYKFFQRRMVNPLEILKKGTLKIEGGDYLHQITIDSQDEMGDLGKAFNSMANSVHDRNQQLSDSEAQSRLLLESVGEGVFGVDTDDKLTFINPTALTLLGYKEEELLGESIHELIHHTHTDGTSYPIDECPMRLTHIEGKSYHIEDEILWRKDGSSFPVEYRSTPMYRDNDIIGSVVAFVDITERKKAEQKLKENEAKFRNLVESSQAVPFTYDLKLGLYTYMGPRVEEWLGYPPESWTDFDSWANKIHPEDREAAIQACREDTAACRDHILEFRMITADRQTVWIREIISVISKDGEAEKLNGFMFDITDKKKTEAELQLAKEQTEAAYKAKSIFLANMSHELRTPLNAIMGYSQIMSHDSNLSTEQFNALDSIKHNGQHLLNIINDILDMSKIEAGKIKLHLDSISLDGILKDITSISEMRTKQKDLNFELIVNEGVPHTIFADEIRLRQVLLNLLSNAFKFTTEGNITLEVSVQEIQKDQIKLLFSLKDTGCGIDPNKLEKIFIPFEQISELMTANGTGLGLSISKELVELMGGDITVVSEKNKGSAFNFYIITKAIKEPIQPVKQKSQNKVLHLKPKQLKTKILVVDDNQSNLQMLSNMLKHTGFTALEATNGLEAIEIFSNKEPDLILMDLKMPKMDGLEATAKIRSKELGKKIPIIGVSASVLKDQQQSMLESGMDSIIKKPIIEEELLSTLGEFLNVEYLYKETEELIDITKQPLESVDEDIKEKLQLAVSSGDIEQLNKLCIEISSLYPTVAALIKEKVDEFDIGAIEDIVKELN